MEDDDVLMVTVNISSVIADTGDVKNVSVSQSYPVDTTWPDIMSQCIRSLNSYGFVIKDRNIYVDSDGYVSSL